METFRKLFGSLLAFVDHCFDRIVIQGYLPLLTRPEHIVPFFRDVHGIYPINQRSFGQAQIFGVRKHHCIRGKLHSLLEKLDHGHHVLRIYCKGLLARMYEKFATFLRLEVRVNRLKDLGLNNGWRI